MTAYADVVKDRYERPIPGVRVYIRNQDNTLAEIGEENPTVTDADGIFTIDAADGFYIAEYTYTGSLIRKDIVLVGVTPIEQAVDAANTATAAAASASADAIQTASDRIATAGDRVQTGIDKAATAADRVQTGLDRVSTTASAATATAGATTATTQAGIATAGAATATTKAADAAASAAAVASALPAGISTQKALRQQPGSFDTGASPAGGGYTKTSGQTTFGAYHLNAEDYLARTAGLLFTIKIPIVAGAITAAQITEKDAGGTTIVAASAMTIEAGYAIKRGLMVNASTTQFSFTSVTAGGSGMTIDNVGVSYGEPATTQIENALLAETGAVEDVADAVAFVRPSFYSYVLLAGAAPTFNSVDGLIAPLTTQAQFVLQYPFEVDQLYTLSFTSPNLPGTAIIQAFQDQSFTHAPGSFTVAPLPRLRKVGNHYKVSFYANAQGAGPYPTIGIVLRIDNIAPLTDPVTATDFRIVKGSTRPVHAKTPAVVLEDTRKATRNSLILNAGRKLIASQAVISTQGTSITAGYNGPGGAASNWPTIMDGLLTTQTVVNNAVRGRFSTGMMAAWNSTQGYATVSGGSIPATTTAVQITFDTGVDFFSGFTVSDGSSPLTGSLAGIAGTFSQVTTTYYFTRAVAGSAVAVSGRAPIVTDQGLAARSTINIIEPGRNDEFSPNFIPRPALPDWLMGYVERHLDYMTPIAKQLIVAPPIIGLADGDVAVRQAVDVRYKAMLTAIGIPVLDLNAPPSTAEQAYMLSAFAWSPSAQDLIDMAAGLFPTTLRQADGLHQNLNGNRLHGYRAKNLITDLGWVP